MGLQGLRDLVVNCNNMTRLLETLVQEVDDLVLLFTASTPTVNFRYVPTGEVLSGVILDTINKQISGQIIDGGEAHVPKKPRQMEWFRCARAFFTMRTAKTPCTTWLIWFGSWVHN